MPPRRKRERIPAIVLNAQPPPLPAPPPPPNKRRMKLGTLVRKKNKFPIGASVVVRADNLWLGGTVVTEDIPFRVVFDDGSSTLATEAHVWKRPRELPWHKRRKKNDRWLGHATMRSVEQLDPITLAPIARFPTSRRACEQLAWLGGPEDIVNCCRGLQPQAGGFKWRFAEAKGKLCAADVADLIAGNASIAFQQTNPKRRGTKSADLYDSYKRATSFKQMLALGGRRADISYDLTHGWIAFEDPILARRFGCDVIE